MKTVYIMSAKFAPGHFSHMLAYYELFENLNYKPILYLDENYNEFLQEYPDYNYKYISDNMDTPDVLFIYNLSRQDGRILNTFKKKYSDMKTYFVYHEPWYGFKEWFNDLKSGNESVTESVKTIGRYVFVRRVLKISDRIILPSKTALKNYQKNCIKFNSNCSIFPLIFTDECKNKFDIKEKQYFSFISTASNSKNFSKFIEFVKFSSKKDNSKKFQIATRTDISAYLDTELKALIKSGRLIVNHGHSLSNEEINHAYAISNCTWMLYSRSTQSGVLCKSFMFGTPVIASDIGSFREVVDNSNGIILKDDYSLEDIDNAYQKILSRLSYYSDSVRNTFLNKFHWKKNIGEFNKLID